MTDAATPRDGPDKTVPAGETPSADGGDRLGDRLADGLGDGLEDGPGDGPGDGLGDELGDRRGSDLVDASRGQDKAQPGDADAPASAETGEGAAPGGDAPLSTPPAAAAGGPVERTGKGRAALTVSVVVPCYNEEDAIEDTVALLDKTLAVCAPFEIVVVNDGSTDETAEKLAGIESKYPALRVVTHKANSGYGAALKTGFVAARSPVVAITDADGTYPIDMLPKLVSLIEECDMVVGARTGADVTYSKIRALPKIFLRAWASWISAYDIPDINSGMRVFKREAVLKYLRVLPDGFSFTTTITICMLTNYHQVHYEPINYRARIGKSKIKPIQDTIRFVQLILRTGMYFAPLRVLSPVILSGFWRR
ncbi:MAG: glycosyltransferase [Pseudomonadota bacterium]